MREEDEGEEAAVHAVGVVHPFLSHGVLHLEGVERRRDIIVDLTCYGIQCVNCSLKKVG